MPRRAILLAGLIGLLCAAEPARGCLTCPTHERWRATFTTADGATASFKALATRVDHYGTRTGGFRCRGPVCPSRRGTFELSDLTGPSVDITFRGRLHTGCQCFGVERFTADRHWEIGGDCTCFSGTTCAPTGCVPVLDGSHIDFVSVRRFLSR